ncbi:MAG TPA: hypothetical protein VGD62_10470 [Acidobacteriaceae bacterium]
MMAAGMEWLWLRVRRVAAELMGLFVEDAGLALGSLAWIGVVWLLLPALRLGVHARALALGLGLMAILGESALRAARRRRG